MDKGWIAAIAWVFICGAVNAFLRLTGEFDVNPFVMTSQAMLAGSFILIALAGPGSLGLETIRAPHTWLFGISFLISVSSFVTLASMSSSTEATLLIRTSVIASFLLAPLVGRPFNKLGLVGLSAIALGIGIVLLQIPTEILGKTIVFTGLFALFQALHFLSSETHKTNSQVQTFKQRMRVAGYVLAATALLFIVFLLITSIFVQATGYESNLLPKAYHFISPASYLIALVYGLFGVSTLRYCEFVATQRIGFEYFTAFVCGVIATTFAFEAIFSFAGLYPWRHISAGLVPAALLVMIGSYMTMLMTQKRDPKDMSIAIPTLEEIEAKYERDYAERNAATQEGYKELDKRRDEDYRRKLQDLKKR